MTDEERQQLCDWLRHLPAYLSEEGMQAAEEIERLAALAQPDAEPVAWQYRNEISKTIALGIGGNKHPISIADDVLALLAAPPRPDAARSEIERLVQERKMERLVQERDSALATLKAHGIMK